KDCSLTRAAFSVLVKRMKLISYALFLNCLKKDIPIPLDSNLKVMTRAKYMAVSTFTPVSTANFFIPFTSVHLNCYNITIFQLNCIYWKGERFLESAVLLSDCDVLLRRYHYFPFPLLESSKAGTFIFPFYEFALR